MSIHFRSLTLFSFILFFHASLFAQVSSWINALDGVGSEICVDPFGNSLGCGQFVGTVEIGDLTFTSAGVQDGIVVKTGPNGNVLWATPFGGSDGDYCNEIVFDNANSVWVTGQFSGTMYAGNFTLVSAGGTDAFIVKIDAASGEIAFAERFGSSGNDVGTGIKADIFSNVYISGTYIGNFSFGNISLPGQSQHDIFLVKVNSEGIPEWGSSIKGSGFDAIWSMALDDEANSYLAGFTTSGSASFGGTVLNFAGTTHFIAKFDSNGTYVWSALSEFNGEVFGMCTDAELNVYFTGNFDTQAMFGNIELTGIGWDDILLGKINSDGTYAWVRAYGGSGNDQGYDVECKSDGELFVTGTFEGAFAFGDVNLSAGGFSKSYLANFDPQGEISWVIQSTGPAATAHFTKSVTHTATGEIYLSGDGNNSITMGGVSAEISGSFLVKLFDGANVIKGQVFRDWNSNGINDAEDTGIPNTIVQLNGGPGIGVSNNEGIYEVYCGTGPNEVSIPSIPLYHALTTPEFQNADFVGLGNLDTDNDFGLNPTPGIVDLRIDITPVSSPKAGFVLVYMITYTNAGTEAVNATINLLTDANISYLGASPEPDFQSGQNTSWNMGMLEPQMSGSMHAYFSIPVNMNIGDIVTSEVSISSLENDLTPADNSMQTSSAITGPYDPNYKEVSADTLYNITQEDWLTYTIHFQNIGNDSAHTVIITDSLSHQLNLSSIEILASSHEPMDFSISNGYVGQFRFDNIMLPDSATDPLGSMGFVKYRVKHLQTIPFNDSIVNFADIYFDYNPPIRTDSAVTYHLDGTTSIQSIIGTNQFIIYPNPANNFISIADDSIDDFISGVVIYDANGRIVSNKLKNSTFDEQLTISIEHLSPGLYMIEIRTSENIFINNFIKY